MVLPAGTAADDVPESGPEAASRWLESADDGELEQAVKAVIRRVAIAKVMVFMIPPFEWH